MPAALARSRYQAERPATAAVAGILAAYRRGRSGLDGLACLPRHGRLLQHAAAIEAAPRLGLQYGPRNGARPASPPLSGKPMGKEWWENGSRGLREKPINEADATSSGFSCLVVAVAPILTSEQQEVPSSGLCSITRHRRRSRRPRGWPRPVICRRAGSA